jgi:hypothetical protein
VSTRQTAGFSPIPQARMISSPAPLRTTYRHWLLTWVGGIFAILIVSLFVASFFLDDMIRSRTQAAMNQKLTGYHVVLAHAHLQLVGGRLTLDGLKIVQHAHPHPAIAEVPSLRFHIEWKELLSRRVVADVLLSHPKVHIDQTQLVAEKKRPGPVATEGLAGRTRGGLSIQDQPFHDL